MSEMDVVSADDYFFHRYVLNQKTSYTVHGYVLSVVICYN